MDYDKLVEAVGIYVAGELRDLERQVEELRKHLEVVRVADTKGFTLKPDPSRLRLQDLS